MRIGKFLFSKSCDDYVNLSLVNTIEKQTRPMKNNFKAYVEETVEFMISVD